MYIPCAMYKHTQHTLLLEGLSALMPPVTFRKSAIFRLSLEAVLTKNYEPS